MATRGREHKPGSYDAAVPGTIYWTLSLYIEPDRVAQALGRKAVEHLPSSVFRRAQMRHLPSLALRNAIDPLFNDIADRETQGEVQEYLLATTAAQCNDLEDAAALIRQSEPLTFKVEKSTTWMTEGVTFEAHPPALDDPRRVGLRTFWVSHNNGALTYHLSFNHHYAEVFDENGVARSGYDPSTYYFLSLLQKLAAPKEYALKPELLTALIETADPYVDVFSDTPLGIDPLDTLKVEDADGSAARFWPFVQKRLTRDARALFPRLARELDIPAPAHGFETGLVDMVPFIEVPGLKVPKSRFMFVVHDERLFDRLMPLDAAGLASVPRKSMVRDGCYAPYQKQISDLTAPDAKGLPPRRVHLGEPTEEQEKKEVDPRDRVAADFWNWATKRAEYDAMLAAGGFARAPAEGAKKVRGAPPHVLLKPNDHDGLKKAMREGTCVQLLNAKHEPLATPIRHHVPAFELNRADCLDYLFLAGFNQNIIDFMNQDTSEILDSIDPIYPDSDEQSDERFFVRYANHRAMITYVPRSRSLEIGNDYIGTCPYAFLIHLLALHNEFLARAHEERSMARIERITAMTAGRPPRNSAALEALQDREKIDPDDAGDPTELLINRAKLAEFEDYERFRYANPFRYDTERDVFAKLQDLRGTNRKQAALTTAIASLEDHASDLRRRRQQRADQESARRDLRINLLLGGMGIFGAGQMIYWIGEKAAGEDTAPKSLLFSTAADKQVGTAIMGSVEVAMAIALALFVPLLIWILVDAIRASTRR
ncbi:hypothetical protein K9B35_09365 [Sphingomonas sp. R647]|uniref:hypothetical protein n=1 Tax=Sphingomonas sp. R647 TaxID=2875233 RepID=UPI001CD75889|nr:hypothetical protein [Sphingomonas sp. R647]MCA1198174.1 hypothetical protein [Sphingomonas sp. R647]